MTKSTRNRIIRVGTIVVVLVSLGILAAPQIRRGVSSHVGLSFANGLHLDGIPYPLRDSHLYELSYTPSDDAQPDTTRRTLTLIFNGNEFPLRTLSDADVQDMGAVRNTKSDGWWDYVGRDSRGSETWLMEFKFCEKRLCFFRILRICVESPPDVFFGWQGTSERISVPCGERGAEKFFGDPIETSFWTRG